MIIDCTVLYGPLAGYLLFACFLWYVWNNRRFYVLSWQSAGPLALPVLGNALQYGRYLSSPAGIVKIFEEISRKYSTSVRVWCGPKLFYFVQTPEDLSVILNSPKCLKKEETHRRLFSALVGDGLFTAPVATWRVHRKALNPMFSKRMLDGHVNTFCDYSAELSDVLGAYVANGTFDVYKPVTDVVCSLIFETTLGDSPLARKGKSRFIYCTERLKKLALLRTSNIFLYSDLILMCTPMYREGKRLVEEVNAFTISVINEKREILRSEAKYDYEQVDGNDGKSKSVVEFLLELTETGEKYTDQECIHEVITFLFGGNDTIGTTVSYAVLALALHQDVQDRVIAEIRDVCADEQITSEHLPRLKYLERVIKETLRIFPVNMIHGRECTDDVKLNDSVTLPAGTPVALCYHNVLRSPVHWPDPLRFDPDRFLPDQTAKRHPFAFVPFGGGPRNCIGYRFGIQCAKVVLAHVFRKYRFTTDFKDVADVDLEVGTTTRPTRGFMVRIDHN